MHQMIGYHLPGKRIMLQQAKGIAFYHLEVHVRLEKHPHQGRMWQNFHHLVGHLSVSALFQYFRTESRPVQAVNPHDSLLYIRRTVHAAVYSQIPALGMSPHEKRSPDSGCHGFQILCAVRLPRHRGEKRHVEILFPAHNGLVRPPEGHIGGTVIQKTCDCRKLRLPLFFHHIHIIVQSHVAETQPLHHSLKKCPVLLFKPHVPEQFFKLRMLLQALQRHGGPVPAHIRHKIVKFQIGQLAQRQAVHLCQRHFLKGIFSVFFQII